MDKYKTSQLGQALKKVFRGKITVQESVDLAQREISEVFTRHHSTPENDTDIGFFMERVGTCPMCGKDVVRGKFGYGCMGYKDGCKFHISMHICGRNISINHARQLLESGQTGIISGFVSKKGKKFDAALKLEDGRANFVFEDRPRPTYNVATEAPPPPPIPDEPPPGY